MAGETGVVKKEGMNPMKENDSGGSYPMPLVSNEEHLACLRLLK